MRRISIAPLLLAGLLAGCHTTSTTTPQPAPIDDECPSWSCGSNTPRVEGAPIEALHLGGEPNARGIRLIPGSLNKRQCGAGLTLDIQGGVLVGRVGGLGGRIVCRGADLLQATFQLEIAARDAAPKQVKIRIAGAGQVYPWHMEPLPQPLATYLLVEHLTGAPICPRDEAWMEDQWQQVPMNPDFKPVWYEATRHAILVRGETYRGTDATVEISGPVAADWFNIACAGTAIAKMRLLGYDPLDPSSSRVQRQATLKMITAKYCGSDSFTERGMPLLWGSEPATPYYGLPDPARVDEVEARWNEHGAVCLSHARAWRANHAIPAVLANYCRTTALRRQCQTESELLDALRHRCGIPACTGLEPAFWATRTVDHIHHRTFPGPLR
jgi:hypothetical protein